MGPRQLTACSTCIYISSLGIVNDFSIVIDLHPGGFGVLNGIHNSTFSVLIIDSDRLIRAGIARLISDCSRNAQILDSESGEDGISQARDAKPDVIILNSSMHGSSSVEIARKLLTSDESAQIILLTNARSQTTLRQYVDLGVLGFLTKNSPVEELCEAIATVINGEVFIASSIATKMAFAVINDDIRSPFDALSPRELEIIMLMLEGRKNQEMAKSLFISEKTVSTYRSRALVKLRIKNTTDLTLLAIRFGLIEEEN